MYNNLCCLCFCLVIYLFILKIIFHLVLVLNSMSWNIGFSRNLLLKLHNKLGLFHIVLEEKFQKISLTIIESQNLPNLQNLDVDSQISHFEWILSGLSA